MLCVLDNKEINMFDIDFDIEWRPWRAVYVILVTGAIFYLTEGNWFSMLTLLTYFDINPDGLSED